MSFLISHGFIHGVVLIEIGTVRISWRLDRRICFVGAPFVKLSKIANAKTQCKSENEKKKNKKLV